MEWRPAEVQQCVAALCSYIGARNDPVLASTGGLRRCASVHISLDGLHVAARRDALASWNGGLRRCNCVHNVGRVQLRRSCSSASTWCMHSWMLPRCGASFVVESELKLLLWMETWVLRRIDFSCFCDWRPQLLQWS